MYRIHEQAPSAGLYRCTTCGVMVPLNAGESIPDCPTRCAEPIWTFFDERHPAGEGETREAIASFPALDLRGDPQSIPAGARLQGVLLGPEPPGNPARDPDLAAFQFEGKMYFGSAQQMIRNSKVVGE